MLSRKTWCRERLGAPSRWLFGAGLRQLAGDLFAHAYTLLHPILSLRANVCCSMLQQRAVAEARYSLFRDFARSSILCNRRRSRRMFSGNSSVVRLLVASRNEVPMRLMK